MRKLPDLWYFKAVIQTLLTVNFNTKALTRLDVQYASSRLAIRCTCMMYVKWVFGILHGVVFVGCKKVVCCTPDITHYVYMYSDEWKLIQK